MGATGTAALAGIALLMAVWSMEDSVIAASWAALAAAAVGLALWGRMRAGGTTGRMERVPVRVRSERGRRR